MTLECEFHFKQNYRPWCSSLFSVRAIISALWFRGTTYSRRSSFTRNIRMDPMTTRTSIRIFCLNVLFFCVGIFTILYAEKHGLIIVFGDRREKLSDNELRQIRVQNSPEKNAVAERSWSISPRKISVAERFWMTCLNEQLEALKSATPATIRYTLLIWASTNRRSRAEL